MIFKITNLELVKCGKKWLDEITCLSEYFLIVWSKIHLLFRVFLFVSFKLFLISDIKFILNLRRFLVRVYKYFQLDLSRLIVWLYFVVSCVMYKYYYDQTGLWICKVILSIYVTKCGQSLFWVQICLVFSVQKTIFLSFTYL